MTPAERLARVCDAIANAATLAGRDPGEVTLIAVTKGRPVEAIQALIEAGQRDFGESRVQEAQEKWPPLLKADPGLRLHCIGRLQSNKAAEATRLFSTLHSVDRPSLLDALESAIETGARAISTYVQVNIGDEPQKGGCAIDEVGGMVSAVRATALPLAGLMCIPPADLEPGPYFALLAEIARRHDVSGLSMGMSADFATAVQLGATAVRVGSALFEDE
jgi:pyridoxal phosphate enzyme (YggS family)